MKSLLDWFKKNGRSGAHAHLTPWPSQTPLFDYILKNTGSDGFFSPSALVLPDSSPAASKSAPLDTNQEDVYAPHGKADVAPFLHPSESSDDHNLSQEIADIIHKLTIHFEPSLGAKLYGLIKIQRTHSYIEHVFEKLRHSKTKPTENLIQFFLNMIYKSPDREPIKFAITLLCRIGELIPLKDLLALGIHEEFTFTVVWSLLDWDSDTEAHIWHLAKHTRGWGRIASLFCLKNTKNPDIKGWLLAEGYKNAISLDYTALLCAMAGELHLCLNPGWADPLTMQATAEILDALVSPGPGSGLIQYPYAGLVITFFILNLEQRVYHPYHIYVAEKILQILSLNENEWIRFHNSSWENIDKKWLISKLQSLLEERIRLSQFNPTFH